MLHNLEKLTSELKRYSNNYLKPIYLEFLKRPENFRATEVPKPLFVD